MRIYNGTPHTINIINPSSFSSSPTIRKLVSENPIVLVEYPSNGILNAIFKEVPIEMGLLFKTVQKQVISCDPLPEGFDLYIVSALYAVAVQALGCDISKLLTVCNPVFTPDGRTVLGCEGLMSSRISC
jgi:hypothetical protein